MCNRVGSYSIAATFAKCSNKFDTWLIVRAKKGKARRILSFPFKVIKTYTSVTTSSTTSDAFVLLIL